MMIPYLLTFLIGMLTLQLITQNRVTLSTALFVSLSALTGITVTIFITFLSFAFLNQFHLLFIIIIHATSILLLFLLSKPNIPLQQKKLNGSTFLTILIPLLAGILAFINAEVYPFGGWDAWAVWNFKSKFLLLAGDRWKEIFDPTLIRSHPHYPIGLPLFNSWTWAFTEGTAVFAPLLNAVLFNMLTALLIIGLFQQRSASKSIFLPVSILFLTPVYMTYTTNQYCDVLIGLYLLAATGTIAEALRSSNDRLFILSGIFIGTLPFLKLEGLFLSVLLFSGAHFYILKTFKKIRTAALFWTSTFLSMIPAALFFLFLFSKSQDFTNGLISPDDPSTILRLRIILTGLLLEISSVQWRPLWAFVLTAGILYFRRIFRKDLLFFPFIILTYLWIVILQYWVNTYHPIVWWLSVSLGRILTAMIPTIILWISLGMLPKKSSSD